METKDEADSEPLLRVDSDASRGQAYAQRRKVDGAQAAWRMLAPVHVVAIAFALCIALAMLYRGWRSAEGRIELDVASAALVEDATKAAALSLEDRCGDDCKFILPTYIGEQESRAQVHLYQLAVWAHGLGRILVLPSVRHSRYSVCYSRPFEFYYAADTLSRLGLPTVSKAEFQSWTRARVNHSATAQIIRVRNPTYKGKRIPHPSPMIWNDTSAQGYPVGKGCLGDNLNFSGFHPVSFYGNGWDPVLPPGELDFLAKVFTYLRDGLGFIIDSGAPPHPTVLSFHIEGQHHPDFTPTDLVALSPSTPLALPFEIFHYSKPLIALAAAMIDRLSPFIAVQWRTEEVDPAHLAPCGRNLIEFLERAKAQNPSLSAVYLATDYPFESLRNTSISGEAHSQSYKISQPVHAAMRTFKSEWDAEVARGLLPRLTTWDEEEHELDVPAESLELMGMGHRLRDADIALLGMVDKMVATKAELFFAGEENKCGKLSSFMKAIADTRERVLADVVGGPKFGTPGEVWNSVEYFVYAGED